MSSKHNDNNNTIHLGNYEEFFILYMDNELTPEQMKMVDAFLVLHPDLRGEFEMLMGTKLPVEEFNIIKDELYSDNMQSSSVGEDLLSYIDNELDAEKTKIVELELAANSDYRLQHTVLLKAKLDPSEKISHPNKEELYRRTERVIAFKPWMRVAAAVLIIAVSGIAYFNSSSNNHSIKPDTAASNNPEQKRNTLEPTGPSQESNIAVVNPAANSNSSTQTENKQNNQTTKEVVKVNSNEPGLAIIHKEEKNDDLTAVNDQTHTEKTSEQKENSEIYSGMTASIGVQETVNNPGVTSNTPIRINTNAVATDPKLEDVVADRKSGSVKGFLRKATRMIEKRTGIDPTNDNGELLLGAVAVKLK
jgi:hypothetical protein